MAEDKHVTGTDVVAAAERFFLDLIGTVIPGLLLILGWVLLFGQPSLPGMGALTSRDVLAWLLPVVSYVLGHFVTGFGSQMVEWTARFLPFVKTDNAINAKIGKTPVYRSFVHGASEQFPWLANIPEHDVHAWRNIAMSLTTSEENHTIYRFMFISLLNLGAGTVCVLLTLAWFAATVAAHFPFAQPWGSVLFSHRRPFDIGVMLVVIVLAYFFFERRGVFYPRALRVPFSMASVKIAKRAPEVKPASAPHKEMPTLYLAGGTHSGWQDTVIAALPTWQVIDPRTHGLHEEREYTLWDLDGLRRCDYVLANLEATNPGGYNLAFEVGYAKALGKRVVFIDAKSGNDARQRRHVSMLQTVADATPTTLAGAIVFLQQMNSANLMGNIVD